MSYLLRRTGLPVTGICIIVYSFRFRKCIDIAFHRTHVTAIERSVGGILQGLELVAKSPETRNDQGLNSTVKKEYNKQTHGTDSMHVVWYLQYFANWSIDVHDAQRRKKIHQKAALTARKGFA